MTDHDHGDLHARITDLVGEVRAGRVEQRVDHAAVRADLAKVETAQAKVETAQLELGSEVRQLKTVVVEAKDLAQTTAKMLVDHLHEHALTAREAKGREAVWSSITRPVRKAIDNIDKVAVLAIALASGGVGILIGLAS